MKKPNRRSDKHDRRSRNLSLRIDLYDSFEDVAIDKGHSVSSATERIWEALLADKKLLAKILKP